MKLSSIKSAGMAPDGLTSSGDVMISTNGKLKSRCGERRELDQQREEGVWLMKHRLQTMMGNCGCRGAGEKFQTELQYQGDITAGICKCCLDHDQ